jgi:hypothetical protein
MYRPLLRSAPISAVHDRATEQSSTYSHTAHSPGIEAVIANASAGTVHHDVQKKHGQQQNRPEPRIFPTGKPSKKKTEQSRNPDND